MDSTHGTVETTRVNTSAPSDAGQESYNNSSDYVRGNDITDQPLSVYRNKSGSVRNITADICTSLMRSLAVEVYGLTKRSEIQAFSCHSLRVGACCILYATGYSGEFIQRALRWRSEAWKTYVRDLVVVTIQHNKAMSEADTMPLM